MRTSYPCLNIIDILKIGKIVQLKLDIGLLSNTPIQLEDLVVIYNEK